MTIKRQILDYLIVKKDFVFGGTIEDYIRQVDGAKSSNVSRRLRELYREGKIERRLVKFGGVNVVQYRITEPKSWNEMIDRRNLNVFIPDIINKPAEPAKLF